MKTEAEWNTHGVMEKSSGMVVALTGVLNSTAASSLRGDILVAALAKDPGTTPDLRVL